MNRLFSSVWDALVAPTSTEEGDEGLTLLFLAATPIFLWFLGGGMEQVLVGAVVLVLLVYAFWLISEGLKAEANYRAMSVARKPRKPRKLMGSCLLGVTVASLGLYQMGLVLVPLVLGVLSTLLTVLSFGIDPMKDKGNPRLHTSTSDQPKRRVMSRNVRSVLETMLSDVIGLGDTEVSARFRELREMAIRVLVELENDPTGTGDLRKLLRETLEDLDADIAAFLPAYRASQDGNLRAGFLTGLQNHRTRMEEAMYDHLPDVEDENNATIEKLLQRMSEEAAA